MKDHKVLGRGLGDLLEEHHIDDVLEGESILEIDLGLITPNPFQPRRVFDQEKIDNLAQSIRTHGVFQPIILKRITGGYMIVSGERRYRAAKQVGLLTIPAIIRAYEEEKVAEIALIENLQREDLTPIEEAEAYQMMMTKLNLTQHQLADKIGKSRSHVTNMLGLLRLPDHIKQYILSQKISMGHARVLSKLKQPKRIEALVKVIIDNNLSVRDLEVLAKDEDKKKAIKRQNSDIYQHERDVLSSSLGAKVDIKGKQIIIKATDEAALQHILALLINK